MYEDYYENEPYYEPTVADEILIEFQQKMKDALLDSVKSEIADIRNVNKQLTIENKAFKDKENAVNSKERDLKYKEDNLKREVEKEFYNSNIGETLERYIEDCELWFADSKRYQKEKCNLCNKSRKLVTKFPNGKKVTTECDCSKFYVKYEPSMTTEQVIKFYKRSGSYSSDRRFYFSRSYTPNKNSNSYDDSYSEFKIGHIVDAFNEDTINIYNELHFGEKLGFRTKEACQQFCDWLNEKEEMKIKNIVPKLQEEEEDED